jgi:multisubunit Na+/H+ antiporter MnhC subunit
MTVNVTLLLASGVLFSCGSYLLMERSLTRVLLGFLLLSNGVNLLLLQSGGDAGEAPLTESGVAPADMADPLPQALILTAIVITFGASAFVLAMIYRSWRLVNGDTISDDLEDRDVATSAAATREDADGPADRPGRSAGDFGDETR